MDPLTCPYCGIALVEDDDELLAFADELVLTQPAFSCCGYCGGIAVAMPPDAQLRQATDLERAAFHRADQRLRARLRGPREGRISRHFALKLGNPPRAQRLGRDTP
jgi:hypothetical protein